MSAAVGLSPASSSRPTISASASCVSGACCSFSGATCSTDCRVTVRASAPAASSAFRLPTSGCGAIWPYSALKGTSRLGAVGLPVSRCAAAITGAAPDASAASVS
jgi:hypothetical protein